MIPQTLILGDHPNKRLLESLRDYNLNPLNYRKKIKKSFLVLSK